MQLFNVNENLAGKRYRRDIDGLRAIAVTSVVLYHAGFSALSGGFVGVDVFFVISGYLITTIIYREVRENRFSLIKFYERRARRILPALFATIGVTSFGAYLLLLPNEFRDYSFSILSVVIFIANFNFSAQLGDYFSPNADFILLLHTWSLAVEEQFYLIFPFVILLAARFKIHYLILILVFIAICSFGIAEMYLIFSPSKAFYFTPARVWELAIGAILAVGVHNISAPKQVREIFAWVGLSLIIGSILLYDKTTPFPGINALAPCVGTGLLIWANRASLTLPGWLLSRQPLVFLGLISYSLYLAHWPILALLRNLTGFSSLSTRNAIIAVILAIVSATLSWWFIERPFRNTAIINQTKIFLLTMIVASSISVAAGAIIILNGLPDRFSPDIQTIAMGREDTNPRREECFERWPTGGLCELGTNTIKGEPVNFLFWGDSHSDALMPGVDRAAKLSNKKGLFVGHGGCPPLLGVKSTAPWGSSCITLFDRVAEFLLKRDDIETVILFARWAWATVGGNEASGATDNIGFVDVLPLPHSSLEPKEVIRRGLTRTIQFIRSTGRRVVLIEGVPEIGWNVPTKLLNQARFGLKAPKPPDLEAVTRRNKIASDLLISFTKDPKVKMVTLNDVLCTPLCSVQINGIPLYVDDDHLSRYAAEIYLAPFLANRIWGSRFD